LEAELIGLDDVGARIRVDGGVELRIPAQSWPAASTRAKLSIRPEKLHLSKSPLTGENRFEARVEEEYFKGPTDRFVLTATTGTRFHVTAANESALREAIHAGDRVWCAVHADDI